MGFKSTLMTVLLCLAGIVSMNAQPPQGAQGSQEQRGPNQLPDWTQDIIKRVQIDAYAQGGYTYQHTGGENTNTFELKRVFLVVAAPITDRWFAMFMHDFSSEVHEYWTSYRFTNNKALNARIGQFKNALSIENAMSPTELEAIEVCSEGVTYLAGCGSDRLIGTQYGRDLGMEVFGETNNGKFAYRVGIMNGQGINQKDQNNAKDFLGKVEFHPTKELTLVASGQVGRGHAVAKSPYSDIATGTNYTRNRWTLGFTYKSKPLSLRSEYLEGRDGSNISRGFYMTGVVPIAKHVDAIGSYDFFNYNINKKMDQHKFILGAQWWFYKHCRIQMQYVYKSAYLKDNVLNIMGEQISMGKSFEKGANHAIMCQLQVRLK